MGWFLLAMVVGMVAFAAIYDGVARRRGSYLPPEAFHAARERRKVNGRPFGSGAGRKDRPPL